MGCSGDASSAVPHVCRLLPRGDRGLDGTPPFLQRNARIRVFTNGSLRAELVPPLNAAPRDRLIFPTPLTAARAYMVQRFNAAQHILPLFSNISRSKLKIVNAYIFFSFNFHSLRENKDNF